MQYALSHSNQIVAEKEINDPCLLLFCDFCLDGWLEISAIPSRPR